MEAIQVIVCLLLIGVVWVLFSSRRDTYQRVGRHHTDGAPFRSQRIAKGFSGVGHTEGTPPGSLKGAILKIPTVGPADTVDYDKYSMYSTKVWPTVYQPVTNTCYDEFMRGCSPSCNNIAGSRRCLENCSVRGTEICSRKENLPKLVVH